MTATRHDEKVARLISEHGHAGYGLWWMVLEIVAATIDGDSQPSVTYPVTTWSHLLSLRGSHVRQAMVKLELTHLVTVEWSGSDVTVTIPNLLKYRDEYSRKSGQAQDNVRSKKQIQIQIQNTDTEAHTKCATDAAQVDTLFPVAPEEKRGKVWFDSEHQRWYTDAYWRHIGPRESRRAYEKRIRALVTSGSSFFDAAEFLFSQAIADKLRFAGTKDWDWRQNLLPATWLNGERWNDQPSPEWKQAPNAAQTRRSEVVAGMKLMDQIRRS